MGARKNRLFGPGPVILGLFLLGGAILFGAGVVRLYNACASRHWTRVSGQVIWSGISPWSRSHGDTNFVPDVGYAYSVDSNKYVGSRIRFAAMNGPEEAANEMAARYPRGRPVIVFCKPSNPVVSVLEPGVFPGTWSNAVLGAMGVLLVLGLAGAYRLRARAVETEKKTERPASDAADKEIESLREELRKTIDNAPPPSEQGPLSTMLWIGGIGLLCWLLGRWATPVMVAGEVLLLLLGISILLLIAQKFCVPGVNRLPDPECFAGRPRPRDTLEAQVQELGFHYIGDFDISMRQGYSDRMRAYVDPDRLYSAALIDMTAGRVKTTVLAFCTSLKPSGSVETNNSRHPGITPCKLNKMVAHAPWKKSAAELYKLHQLLCKTAAEEEFQPEPVPTASFAERVKEDTSLDCEYQLERGRYRKLADGAYRMTVFGLCIVVPILWYATIFSNLLPWFKLPDSVFCRKLRSRLRRFKKMPVPDRQPAGGEAGPDGEVEESDDESGAPRPPPAPISKEARSSPRVKF